MKPSVDLLPPQRGVFFDDPSHQYHVYSDSRRCWLPVASTSQVLSVSGAKGFDNRFWRRSLIDKKGMSPAEADLFMELHRDHRASVGTDLHALIREELLGGIYRPVHAESLELLAVWRREFLPHIQRVILCEAPLVSLAYFYSGTPDLIALVDGQWLVLDWKTKTCAEKAKPDAAWALQLAGYTILAEHCHGIALDGALNLMVWSDGCRKAFYNLADILDARATFLDAMVKHHQIRADGGCAIHKAACEHLQTLPQLR